MKTQLTTLISLLLIGCANGGSALSVDEIVEQTRAGKYEVGQKFKVKGEIETVATSNREAGIRGRNKSNAVVVLSPEGTEYKVGQNVKLECEYNRIAHIPDVSEEIKDLYVVTGVKCVSI